MPRSIRNLGFLIDLYQVHQLFKKSIFFSLFVFIRALCYSVKVTETKLSERYNLATEKILKVKKSQKYATGQSNPLGHEQWACIMYCINTHTGSPTSNLTIPKAFKKKFWKKNIFWKKKLICEKVPCLSQKMMIYLGHV